MIVKLLTEHHLEFLSLKGGYTGSSESTLVKMPNCWKSHATAQLWFGRRCLSIHFGRQIGTILAILNLHVAPCLQ